MLEREGANLCAFCRTPRSDTGEEEVERTKNLMEKGNADALNMLAGCYEDGTYGMPQDRAKANEVWLKAGELGYAEAYFSLGNSYYNGTGVDINKKKANHYYELSAMNGVVSARHNLGVNEYRAGNGHRAMKQMGVYQQGTT